MPVRLNLRVIDTAIPVVLGYPFLAKFQPLIDWKRRRVRVTRKGKMFDIPALAAADSYRMTCPVESADEPKVMAIEPSMEKEATPLVELDPTKEDTIAVSRLQEPKWKTKKRLKVSPRKAVEKLIKTVDHTLCGPPCRELPVPECILALNKEFSRLFPAKVPGGLPPSRPTDHRIDLKPDSRIPGQRLYRMAPAEEQELQKQLKVLQDLGFIEPSTSPYGSGVLFVPKANGKLRLCVDYRPLNAITVADVYPLPRIDEMIDNAGKSTWYTKMDLHAGFHQFRLHPEHVERTTFKTKCGTFQY